MCIYYSLSRSLSLVLSLSLPRPLSLSLSLSLACSLSLSLSLSRSLSLCDLTTEGLHLAQGSLSLCLSFYLSLSLARSLSPTLPPSPSLVRSLYLSHPFSLVRSLSLCKTTTEGQHLAQESMSAPLSSESGTHKAVKSRL